MRLKTVVLPAPFGPMIAQMDPLPTVRSTPATAWKPSNAFRTPRTSSTPGSSEPAAEAAQRPDDAARKREQQDDEQRAEDERPVLRVRRDLLVQHEQDQRADGRAVEIPHAAEDRHDEHLGRFRPVGEVGKDAAVEDAEEATGDSRKQAGNDERDQLVASHVDTDEPGALGILSDRGEEPPERRSHDAP